MTTIERRVCGVVAACLLLLVTAFLTACSSSKSGGSTPSATPSGGPSRVSATAAQRSLSPAELKPFVGHWASHGRSLEINPDGSGVVTYRSYIWCSDQKVPDCDRQQGSEIVSGGRATFRLTSVDVAGDKSTGHGALLTATDPKLHPGPVTLVTKQQILTTSFLDGPFCSLTNPPKQWICGA